MKPLVTIAFLVCALSVGAQPPDLPDGTEEARKSLTKLQKTPDGFKIDVWAAEPMLGNTVAFGIDEKNRIYTAETYRFNRGTEEYRHRPFFLEGDLKNNTTDDRLKMYQSFADKFPGGMNFFTKYSERIRLLEDTKGAGKADKATTFADGFNEPLDGLAAGVLPKDGDVYFTCIPHLWKIKADGVKEKLLSGFGVQTAFLGHDLHGLVFGPDGRLYFSVGDRGYHVRSKEGATFSGPRNGAVFRCEPDGSHFEVVHVGLRNPQELAFDQYGNLFAADNNCDKGDDSRLVYIVEGGNSGWNMAYQTMEAPYLTGPWHAEKLWHLQHEGQPAWIVPPVGKLGAGPSGFTFSSGLGLPDRYKNAFFMCNFSSSKGGGLDSFRVVPKGAGFETVDYHQFLGPMLMTDADFGYDGKLYFSDWVQFTWDGGGVGKSRVFSAYDPKTLGDPAIVQMKQVMAEGFDKRSVKELIELLGHGDMRVRLRAQYELAQRRAIAELISLAESKETPLLTRVHAIWGLGQVARLYDDTYIIRSFYQARRFEEAIRSVKCLARLLEDADTEIRVQSVKTIGELPSWWDLVVSFQGRLVGMLAGSPRERYFATMTLAKQGGADAVDHLMKMATENAGRDPYLVHAASFALSKFLDRVGIKKNADPMTTLLALRRLSVAKAHLGVVKTRIDELPLFLRHLVGNEPRVGARPILGGTSVAMFLNDTDDKIRTEAARVINDLPLVECFPDLAGRATLFSKLPQPNEALGRRIINANFRLGTDDHAKALVDIVVNPKVSPVQRHEALACLAEWEQPGPRDRVIGFWRPLPARSADGVRKLIEQHLETLLATSTPAMQTDVVKLIAKLKVNVDDATFAAWVGDPKKGAGTRIESLRLLVARQGARADGLLATALHDKEARLRAAARDLISVRDPERGLDLVAQVLDQGELVEQQSALRSLANFKLPKAQVLLGDWLDRLDEGKVIAGLQLDVFQSAKATANKTLKPRIDVYQEKLRKAGPLEPFRMTLEGGDAERGRHVFLTHTTGQCIRCHKVQGEGGIVGPDLAEWSPKGTREHLLESLILPDKKITPGYGAVTLSLDSGKILAGVLRSEDKTKVVLETPDLKQHTIPLAEIELRSDVKSAMPAMGNVLSLEEMRDVIAYLAGFKK